MNKNINCRKHEFNNQFNAVFMAEIIIIILQYRQPVNGYKLSFKNQLYFHGVCTPNRYEEHLILVGPYTIIKSRISGSVGIKISVVPDHVPLSSINPGYLGDRINFGTNFPVNQEFGIILNYLWGRRIFIPMRR
jgi:hypothetical protein